MTPWSWAPVVPDAPTLASTRRPGRLRGASVTTQLRLLTIVVLALTPLITAAALWVVVDQTNTTQIISRSLSPGIDADAAVSQGLSDARSAWEAEYAGATASGRTFEEARESTFAALTALRAAASADEQSAAVRARYTALVDVIERRTRAAFASMESATTVPVGQGRVAAGDTARGDVTRARASSDELAGLMHEQRLVLRERLLDGPRRALLLTSLVACLGTAVVAVFGRAVDRGVTVPIRDLQRAVQRERDGDRETVFDDIDGALEVRELGRDLQRLTRTNHALLDEQAGILRLHELALDVGREVHGSTDMLASLRASCGRMGEGLGLDRVTLTTLGADGELRKWVQWHAAGLADLPRPSTELLGSVDPLARDLLESGTHVAADRPDDGPREDRRVTAFRAFAEARGLLLVPVGVTDRGLGLLACATTHSAREWEQHEVRAVEQLAGIMAQAIAKQRLLEMQQRRMVEMRALDEQKDTFLATVSHELRTPLTSISGYLEILEDGDLGTMTAQQDKALGVVRRNADRLRGLIEDLLVLNRIETEQFVAAQEPVELADVVSTAVELLRPGADRGEVVLEADVESDLAPVLGDVGQLERMVLNLVGNAVKFTPADGSVSVSARSEGGTIVLEVVDTGIGIPQDDLVRLTERFFRARNATTAQIQGSGLGLSIVRRIVEAHGGELDLTSVEGVGTSVLVRLPLAAGVVPGEPRLAEPVSGNDGYAAAV